MDSAKNIDTAQTYTVQGERNPMRVLDCLLRDSALDFKFAPDYREKMDSYIDKSAVLAEGEDGFSEADMSTGFIGLVDRLIKDSKLDFILWVKEGRLHIGTRGEWFARTNQDTL